MLVRVFSVKGSADSPQPGKSMRMLAMPASARASAMPPKPVFSSLLPPWPWLSTTAGKGPSPTGRVTTAGMTRPLASMLTDSAVKTASAPVSGASLEKLRRMVASSVRTAVPLGSSRSPGLPERMPEPTATAMPSAAQSATSAASA